MGNLFSSIFQIFFGKQQVRILIMGLDAAGKTTILYKLKLGETVSTIPTIGFNVEVIEYKNIEFTIWDVGGGSSLRPFIFKHYYSNSNGLVFVVDSSDRERINEVKEHLMPALMHERLISSPCLIFANKQDIANAMDSEEIIEKLGLSAVNDRNWHIQPACAKSGEGLFEGLQWLATQLTNA